jgi:hypothetical protein
LVENEAQLASNNPAVVRKTLLPNLAITSALTIWVQQFNSVAIDNTQDRWLSDKIFCGHAVSPLRFVW